MSESDNYDKVDLKVYQRLIRKLMYLLCGTKPDIAFTVGQLSKHNTDPRIRHMKVVKKVVRYLKSTMYLELVYRSQLKDEGETKAPIAPSPFRLIRYGDSSYTRDPQDKKLVMGYCYFINGAIVSWCSKKQRTVSTSNIEAEYIALRHIAKEAI